MDSLHAPGMRCLEGRLGTIEETVACTDGCSVKVDGDELCWWWRACALEPVDCPVYIPKPTWRIIIEGDGNTSRAKYVVGKSVVKEASAKRYHKDKHDPAMAARALIGKMFPEEKKPEKPKYFTGRVVCVQRPEGVWLTVGKIYEVNDGTMACDMKHVDIDKVTSVENLNARVKKGVKFIEIKE
jgi:hypothetical protein